MPPRAKLAMLSALLTAPIWAPSAHAADAYLCGPDNVVYVELENLEAMKRSDPCIASYYGLTVAPKPEVKLEKSPLSAKPAQAAAPPIPILGLRRASFQMSWRSRSLAALRSVASNLRSRCRSWPPRGQITGTCTSSMRTPRRKNGSAIRNSVWRSKDFLYPAAAQSFGLRSDFRGCHA